MLLPRAILLVIIFLQHGARDSELEVMPANGIETCARSGMKAEASVKNLDTMMMMLGRFVAMSN